jgi:hypothetical protein
MRRVVELFTPSRLKPARSCGAKPGSRATQITCLPVMLLTIVRSRRNVVRMRAELNWKRRLVYCFDFLRARSRPLAPTIAQPPDRVEGQCTRLNHSMSRCWRHREGRGKIKHAAPCNNHPAPGSIPQVLFSSLQLRRPSILCPLYKYRRNATQQTALLDHWHRIPGPICAGWEDSCL